MVKKKCPYCKKVSFSAAAEGRWICPYCSKNLARVTPMSINSAIYLVK